MRGKILVKKPGGQKQNIKIRYLFFVFGFVLSSLPLYQNVKASSCPDVKVVFVRGSGADYIGDRNYDEYRSVLERKLKTTDLSYEFINLEYPAVGVGMDHIGVTLGAYFGAGETYEFGESVKTGGRNLMNLVNNEKCSNTRFVISGYSQGAMVVSRTLGSLNADKIIYAATFGDPKIYLPEGKGATPVACKGEELSDYRMYVPDCYAYKGLLGAYIPYEPEAYVGKLGTWCNKRDMFCSSYLSLNDHLAYVSENLFEDASRVIFDKITKHFRIENTITSPHDTAILIDSTGSMASMINSYKNEAFRLAKETLESGGRVALYDYRDLADSYEPVLHCDFDACTLETFQAGLDEITASGGGDAPESLLSASFTTMSNLKWKYGATKSLVVLTDASYLSPDRDGITLDEVVALSKEIDPVNFYIITRNGLSDYYQALASATGGKVVTEFDEFSILTDYIMERYDSLPRVEEIGYSREKPVLEINESSWVSDNEYVVKFTTNGERTLVIINDTIVGTTTETEITIYGLDVKYMNRIALVPLGDEIRGDSVEVELSSSSFRYNEDAVLIPLTPNTGKR